MSKVLLLSHACLSQEIYNAIELIMGKVDERVSYLTLPYGVDIDQYQKQIEDKVLDAGKEGILIVTDLFGGSPFMVSARVYQTLPYGVDIDQYQKQIEDKVLDAGKEGILIVTDLFGGSPFMVSARVYQKHHENIPMEIVTGMNLPMLAELMINLDKTAPELKKVAMNAGIQGVVNFTQKI